jgi:hypothetical protein
MQRVSAVPVLAAVAAVMLLLCLPGCGSNGPSASSIVTQVVVTPSILSLNQGGVLTLSVVAQNSAGTAIAADISFSSSNTNIATVSAGGLICGGIWDASFINCNAIPGQAGVGVVTITAIATANGVKANATLYVHEPVDQVKAILVDSCTTMGQQVNIYAQVLSSSAPGCTPSAPCDITSTVGPISFGSNDTSIVSINAAGHPVAVTPGATSVFASNSGVNSVGTPYMTCAVATIQVHSATSSDTSFTLGTGGTQTLTADVYDTMNQYIKPTLTWGSSSTATATVAATGSVNNPGTITAVQPGTAYITASCAFPSCNKYLSPQYSQNVVTATVSGGTNTSVYAASTNSTMLVPFSIQTDTPGTAITLPHIPNSIIANPAGTAVYLGSASGLMAVSVSTGTVTTYAVNGTIEAISPDGTALLVSDTVDQSLNYFNLSTGTLSSAQSNITAISAAYTPDSGFVEWISGTQLLLGFGLPSGTSGMVGLPNNSAANALDIMAQGGLTYITSAGAKQIFVFSTCNQSLAQTLTATAPTLVAAVPNGTGAVAADSPNIDVISTPSVLSAGCPVTTQSTISSYDLGAGSFTAQQVFVSPDGTRAWIVSNLPQLLTFSLPSLTPTNIPLTGGATAFNGGITKDSGNAYFGASDGTVHRILVNELTDVTKIAVNLKDANGNVTPPNLVVVVP